MLKASLQITVRAHSCLTNVLFLCVKKWFEMTLNVNWQRLSVVCAGKKRTISIQAWLPCFQGDFIRDLMTTLKKSQHPFQTAQMAAFELLAKPFFETREHDSLKLHYISGACSKFWGSQWCLAIRA